MDALDALETAVKHALTVPSHSPAALEYYGRLTWANDLEEDAEGEEASKAVLLQCIAALRAEDSLRAERERDACSGGGSTSGAAAPDGVLVEYAQRAWTRGDAVGAYALDSIVRVAPECMRAHSVDMWPMPLSLSVGDLLAHTEDDMTVAGAAGESADVSEKQLRKDMERDEVLVNGVMCIGAQGFPALLKCLTRSIADASMARSAAGTPLSALKMTEGACRRLAMLVLQKLNRTESGMLAFAVLRALCHAHRGSDGGGSGSEGGWGQGERPSTAGSGSGSGRGSRSASASASASAEPSPRVSTEDSGNARVSRSSRSSHDDTPPAASLADDAGIEWLLVPRSELAAPLSVDVDLGVFIADTGPRWGLRVKLKASTIFHASRADLAAEGSESGSRDCREQQSLVAVHYHNVVALSLDKDTSRDSDSAAPWQIRGAALDEWDTTVDESCLMRAVRLAQNPPPRRRGSATIGSGGASDNGGGKDGDDDGIQLDEEPVVVTGLNASDGLLEVLEHDPYPQLT